MNILIANDDGVGARGLRELARALHEQAGATVYVCAPDGQRSATGHGITMNRPITVHEAEVPGAVLAWQTSGLPADCVKVAREFLTRQGIAIDMVFSGINHGGNLGSDTLYSGTVSAALEGSLCGYPSVAVSVDSHAAEHFDYACELAVKAAKALYGQIEAGTANAGMVLNINVPNQPKAAVKGLRYTRLGPREYREVFVPADQDSDATARERETREAARAAGDRGAAALQTQEAHLPEVEIPGAFRYSGVPVQYPDLSEEYDVVANQDGYASITPIHTDLTDFAMIRQIQDWDLG